MPTPAQLATWDLSGLQTNADNATKIADAIVKSSGAMHDTIYNLLWQGASRQSAEGRADREQTQMRAIATAYDDLSTACAGAARDLADPLAKIRSILQHYGGSPVAVADDWTVSGVEDWNSEAGIELSKLSGLVATLEAIDSQWGAQIAAANGELAAMAPAAALVAANTEIQNDKTSDTRADPERIRTSAAAFEQVFGRPPVGTSDWATAESLNPKSYDPKYQGVEPEVRVVRITPVPGQGVVRTGQFIEQRDVTSTPKGTNPFPRDRGDNRTTDPNFDPEHTRVTAYVDYDNGIVVMRQNPSVEQNSDGTPGEVKVATPEGRVWQNPDGAVRVQYDAANPFAPSVAKSHWALGDHTITVNGDLVFTPGDKGVQVNGTRTDYPSLEVYQDRPNGQTSTVAIDSAVTGRSWGPAMNLPFHHDIGSGAKAFSDFYDWNPDYDTKTAIKPSTVFGPVTAPPHVPVLVPKGMI
ncbi:MAG: hypothetical protein JWN03_8587 [Nocardia sp.]|uniref:hypothetical protein n=1 Tax=Nocardia sp. TaxID=1821 RepID=UPI00260B6C47|nr:hypothetical protein [Nocardia sp.]MCU1648312.1 hypothetical protein [Nocardia sp.]